MTELSEMLNSAIPDDWSVDRVWDELKATGAKIGRDTVWRYVTGRNTSVQRQYLEAFAQAFPALKLRELEEAAAVPFVLEPWTPPAEANSLTRKEREALELIIRGMANAHGLERKNRRTRSESSDGRPTVADLKGLPSAAEPQREDDGSAEGDAGDGWST